MAKHIIESDGFSISLDIQVFERDIDYPTNAVMNVRVESCGFVGCSSMDIDIKQFARFCVDLSKLYETLAGSAKIEEPYGYKQFIEFKADRLGHILVFGMIRDGDTLMHELKFQNQFEQTYLKDFSKKLAQSYSSYLKL